MVNLLYLFPLLSLLASGLAPLGAGSEALTVSENQISKEISSDYDSKSLTKSESVDNFVIAPSSKSASYGYSNNDYVGYNYYSFSVSNGDTFTLLCNGFTFSRVSFNYNQGAFGFVFSSVNKTVYIDKNGSILTVQLPTSGNFFFSNFPGFTYTDSSLVFTFVDSGVVTESSGEPEPDPDVPEPEEPTISSGDVVVLLNQINDKLSTLEDAFYFSFDFTEMGVFYQVMVVIISLMLLKYFIDFLKWRF